MEIEPMEKLCIACGMPMKSEEDFAAGDEGKAYCRFCCREDGSMQSYEEKLESMADFIEETKEVEREAALGIAKNVMAALPAWEKK